MDLTTLRVALVHDWLDTFRGGEKVLQSLAKLFPQATIFTLYGDPEMWVKHFPGRSIRTLPSLMRWRKLPRFFLLPFLPMAIESFDFNGFDLIISSSSCVAKGILTPPHALHLSYIHSPMRYIWDEAEDYLRSLHSIPFGKLCYRLLSHYLRLWDSTSSCRVDHFMANSHFVKKRIETYYRRPDCSVIHPPIEIHRFTRSSSPVKKRNVFLACGAFVPYKKMDWMIDTCEELGISLIVCGNGPERARLEKKVKNHTRLILSPSNEELVQLMQESQALIVPQREDFGMLSIEAFATGLPVIAFRGGGAMDYIVEGKNGIFFHEHTKASFQKAIERFQSLSSKGAFDPLWIRDYATTFEEGVFLHRVEQLIHREWHHKFGTTLCRNQESDESFSNFHHPKYREKDTLIPPHNPY